MYYQIQITDSQRRHQILPPPFGAHVHVRMISSAASVIGTGGGVFSTGIEVYKSR